MIFKDYIFETQQIKKINKQTILGKKIDKYMYDFRKYMQSKIISFFDYELKLDGYGFYSWRIPGGKDTVIQPFFTYDYDGTEIVDGVTISYKNPKTEKIEFTYDYSFNSKTITFNLKQDKELYMKVVKKALTPSDQYEIDFDPVQTLR